MVYMKPHLVASAWGQSHFLFIFSQFAPGVHALIATRAGWLGWAGNSWIDFSLSSSIRAAGRFSWNANRQRRRLYHRYLRLFNDVLRRRPTLSDHRARQFTALLSARQRTKHFSQVPKQ
jgi:hypothetical protein